MYNKLPWKSLTITCWGTGTIMKTDITKMWKDMEQHIPKSI